MKSDNPFESDHDFLSGFLAAVLAILAMIAAAFGLNL